MIITLTASFSSCVKETGDSGIIKVVGTVFPQYDFARAVGGNRVECEMLMSPGTDSHSYTGDNPSDILKIQKSDLFIYVGGETDESWVEKVLDTIENSGETPPKTIALTDVCNVIEESDVGIMENDAHEDHEEHGEHEESEYDEHVWTSLSNCVQAVSAIKEALCELDPDGRAYYEQNAKEYTDRLLELDRNFDELFDGKENITLVFADRFPFRYFAEDHSLECYAAFNGCASQSEPSPTTIVKLCNIVTEKNLPYIFYTETSQSAVPEVMEKATGATALMLHSCHTVSENQLKSGVTFLELWQKNYDTLEKAFKND